MSSFAASARLAKASALLHGACGPCAKSQEGNAPRVRHAHPRCPPRAFRLQHIPCSTFLEGSTGREYFLRPQLPSIQSLKHQGGRHERSPQQAVAKAGAGQPPYNVVITGSSKGIGLALAREFLAAGDQVCLCARDATQLEAQQQELEKEYPGQTIVKATDVTKSADVVALADYLKEKMVHVDLWINNAGTNAYTYKPLVENSAADIERIVATNTLGVMLCCRQAINLMREQSSRGHIFNMDGAGADGNPTPRFAAYGATKRGLAQFTKSLQAELKLLEIKNVTVHNLSPGMVTTDLLMAGADRQQARFFINALAEPPDVVASFLVPRIRAAVAEADGKSKYIRFLTSPKAYSQILARLLFKSRKDRYVKEAES